MKHDPIVEEVRTARAKILEACGGDLEKMLDRYKAAETQDRRRVVSSTAPAERRGKGDGRSR